MSKNCQYQNYLFRAKDKKNGFWRIGSYVEVPPPEGSNKKPVGYIYYRNPNTTDTKNYMLHSEIDINTLGIWTGLWEKRDDRKEQHRIFTNDYVINIPINPRDKPFTGEVILDAGGIWIRKDNNYAIPIYHDADMFKIIGNKFDGKEKS